MPTFNTIYKHIREQAGCSQTRAKRAARRCYFDPVFAYQVLGVEMYHRLYADPTGEQATELADMRAA